MLPALQVGLVHLTPYYVVYSLAILLCGMLAFHRLVRSGFPPAWAAEVVSLIVLAGAGGAVVFYTALRLAGDGTTTSAVFAARGGSTIFGALLGGGCAGAAYFRWRSVPLGQTLDLVVVPVPLGQAIGRFGCLFAGCCYGRPTSSLLGMNLPGDRGEWRLRYPAQPLSSVGDLLILLALIGAERYGMKRAGSSEARPLPGFLTLLYLALYCLKRFAIEFLRDERPIVLPPFSWAHAASLTGFLVAAGSILRALRRARALHG